jgi:predicted nucleic acid-binding protein
LTVYLLDVNILIPLIHPTHEFAPAAKAWFEQIRADGWATCPQTENGLIRILSGPKYPTPSNDPVYYAGLLRELTQMGNHLFWPDDISSRDILNNDMQLKSKDFPDLYLLTLAIKHGGKFATFDQNVPAHIVPGGMDAIEAIPL